MSLRSVRSVRRIVALAAVCVLPVPALSALTGCHEQVAAAENTLSTDGETLLTAEQVRADQIEVAPVSEHPVDEVVATMGRVTFDDLKVAHIFSPVTGRVASMTASLGQHVKRGDALATIVSPDIGQWSSDLGKASADLIAAEHDFKRKTELLAVKAVAQADYEASEDAYRQAKAEKQRAELKSQMLRGGKSDAVNQSFTLTTPIDGEVIARMLTPGVEVQGQYANGAAVELLTVGQLDTVWVMADIYESDLGRVRVGSPVVVSALAYPGKTFEGKVDWVSGTLDPQTRTAKVRCTFDNKDRLLKPEMYANVRITASQARQALSVPRSAVVRLGEQAVVFAQAGQMPDGRLRFERLPVTVDDAVEGAFVTVDHGVAAGDKIVTHGAQALSQTM
jgi:cobalt-zinc-cadmium efflux system membrane fusion protein